MEINKEKLIEQVNLLLMDSEVSLSYIERFESSDGDEKLFIKNSSFNKGQINACKYFLKIIEKFNGNEKK